MSGREGKFALIRALWEPIEGKPKKPDTETLFNAIAGEAEACLQRSDWEERIRNIERLVNVIRWRMKKHWEDRYQEELNKLVKKTSNGGDENVEYRD